MLPESYGFWPQAGNLRFPAMTKDASRLSNHALRSLRSLQCLCRRESFALPSSRRMAPRTPCFPDPASPSQSTRRPASRQAVPGGLKGRAAVGPSRTMQVPQAGGRGAWFERRDASFVSAGNRRFPACSQNALRSDDIAGLRPASGQNPSDSGTITRELRSLERQRVPERSSAARAFEAVTSSRKPATPIDTSIPCLGRFQKSDPGMLPVRCHSS